MFWLPDICGIENSQGICGVVNMVKKGSGRSRRAAFLTILPAAFLLAPAAAQAPSLAMLDDLQRGQWEVRFRDGSPAKKICLRTGGELLQLRHGGRGCSRYVVEDTAHKVTVQYTCPGSGYGLTTIRKETGSLAQVTSAGLVASQPFDFIAEARRVGSCR